MPSRERDPIFTTESAETAVFCWKLTSVPVALHMIARMHCGWDKSQALPQVARIVYPWSFLIYVAASVVFSTDMERASIASNVAPGFLKIDKNFMKLQAF